MRKTVFVFPANNSELVKLVDRSLDIFRLPLSSSRKTVVFPGSYYKIFTVVPCIDIEQVAEDSIVVVDYIPRSLETVAGVHYIFLRDQDDGYIEHEFPSWRHIIDRHYFLANIANVVRHVCLAQGLENLFN